MMTQNVSTACTAALLAASLCTLLYAALHDVASRTIPNTVSVILVGLGLCLRLLDHRPLSGVLAGLATFLFAAWLWRRGWFGGGDVKLLAATAIVVPPQDLLALLSAVALSGSALALVYLALRPLMPAPSPRRPAAMLVRLLRAEQWRICRHGPLPYASAIAAGACFTLLR